MILREVAHAKINLTLEVLGKRADGYHELRSVVAPIGLADEVELDDTLPSGVEVVGEVANQERMCAAADNLAWRAAQAMGVKCHIRILKRIPLGAGLGGGSADAAAVIRAVGRAQGVPLAQQLQVAATVGSDVPSLVQGGIVLMEGRGEKVTPIMPEGSRAPVPLFVYLPEGAFCPTGKVYANCKAPLQKRGEIVYNIRYAIFEDSASAIAAACMNDLTAAAQQVDERVRAALEQLAPAQLTGSGAAIYRVCGTVQEAQELANRYGGWVTHIVR